MSISCGLWWSGIPRQLLGILRQGGRQRWSGIPGHTLQGTKLGVGVGPAAGPAGQDPEPGQPPAVPQGDRHPHPTIGQGRHRQQRRRYVGKLLPPLQWQGPRVQRQQAGEQVYVNNTAACAHVAAACAAFGITRVVYTSSVTIYSLDQQARRGGIKRLPADESIEPAPDDWYPLSKWVGEQIFALAGMQHGVRTVSLRPALVVGPDEYAQRGRPRHDRDASGGMWGYVDARDVALAARLALERLDDLPPGNHPFNIGAADAHSALPLSEVIPRFIPELAALAGDLTGTQPGYSIEKARRLLGYEPRYSWRQFVPH